MSDERKKTSKQIDRMVATAAAAAAATETVASDGTGELPDEPEVRHKEIRAERSSPISPLYLAHISPISRLYLAYISPISRLYLQVLEKEIRAERREEKRLQAAVA